MNKMMESSTFKDNEGKWHGICGDDATISFNGTTASGYEIVNGKIDYKDRFHILQDIKKLLATQMFHGQVRMEIIISSQRASDNYEY